MSVVDKIRNFVFPPEEEDIEEVRENSETPSANTNPEPAPRATRPRREESSFNSRKSKIVQFNNDPASEIVIVKLETIADVKVVIDRLRGNVPVVFNLARLDRTDASRVIDTVYGASYGLGGNLEKVSNDIFIVAPENVEITGDIKEKIMGQDDFYYEL